MIPYVDLGEHFTMLPESQRLVLPKAKRAEREGPKTEPPQDTARPNHVRERPRGRPGAGTSKERQKKSNAREREADEKKKTSPRGLHSVPPSAAAATGRVT